MQTVVDSLCSITAATNMTGNFHQPVFPMNVQPNIGHMEGENILQNQVFPPYMFSYGQSAQLTAGIFQENAVEHHNTSEIGENMAPRDQVQSSDFQTNLRPYGEGMEMDKGIIDYSGNNQSQFVKELDNGHNQMWLNNSLERERTTNLQSEYDTHDISKGASVNLDDIIPENFNYLLKKDDGETHMIKEEKDKPVTSSTEITVSLQEQEPVSKEPVKSNEIDRSHKQERKLVHSDTDNNTVNADLPKSNEIDRSHKQEQKLVCSDSDNNTVNADLPKSGESDVCSDDDHAEILPEEHVSNGNDDNTCTEAPEAVTCISDDDTILDEYESSDQTVKPKKKGNLKIVFKKSSGVKDKSKSMNACKKKEYKCPDCGKVVQSLRAYDKHLNLHTKKFSCKICGKCFNSQYSLDTHQKVHDGYVGQEQCNVCDKTFYDKSSLNKHTLSVHMGITNFQCEYCDKSFYAKKTYQEHVRVHTGERPFKCKLCPKSYKRIADLNHHMRMHKGEMKHTCEVCGEGFRRISELNRHTQKHENTGDINVKHLIHICEWCELRFSTGKALKQHISSHFDSMDLDKTIMQKAYGSSQKIVDGIVHNLNTKLQNETLHGHLIVQNSIFGEPNFTIGSSAGYSERSGGYTSISKKQSTLSGLSQENIDQSVLLTASKVINTVTGHVNNGNDEINPWTALTNHTKQQMEARESGENPINISPEKFKIKIENVEEDGVDHMYIGQTPTSDVGHDSEDDYSDVGVKQEYNADTDMEDYSYIIKGDLSDSANTDKEDSVPVKDKDNGSQPRKRKRKGQPSRKPRKTKTVKVIDYETASENHDSDNDTETVNDELLDQDYVPPESSPKKSQGRKKKKNTDEEGKPGRRKKKEPESSTYFCEECGKVFSSKFCFKKHQNIHTGVFSCGHCGKSCTSRSSLEVHEASHEGKKPTPSVCKVCDKQFYDPSSMNKHVKNVHMNYRPYPCTYCDRRFPEKKTLVEHLRTHTGERPFKCELCGKTYKRKSELNFHMKWHTGEKNFTCGECGKGFRRMSELKHHNVVQHSAERPYQCTLCMKKFSSKPQLNDHNLQHFGVKNFECEKCFKAFYTRSKLNRHLRMKSDCSTTSTLVNGLHVCRFCLHEFENVEELREHVTTLHEGSKLAGKRPVYSCNICLKEFTRGQALKRHMKIHTQTRDYMCNTCGMGFIQKHHLVQHLRTHTGEKPYQCTFCLKSFAQNATLYSHMKHHRQSGTGAFKHSPTLDLDERESTSDSISEGDIPYTSME